MVTTLLNAALFSGIEASINHLIAMDSGTINKLRPLSGKVVRIHCDSPTLIINLMICDEGIVLGSNEELPFDAMIRGRSSALLKRVVTRDTGNLHGDGIEMRGDTGLVNALQAIFSGMDVDWEYRLSRIIGDIPTQMLSDGLSKTEAFARRTATNLTEDADAWLHEERKVFPASEQLQGFYRRIDDLRLRLDRLQARAARLQTPS